jgi:tagaturonate reductase
LKNIKEIYKNNNYPIKIMQVGEGNFIRAFFGWFVEKMNIVGYNAGISIVQPRPSGIVKKLIDQNNLYTVHLYDYNNENLADDITIVKSVTECIDPYIHYDKFCKLAELDTLRVIVSNTTEAGLIYSDGDNFNHCPPLSFPGKLTKFLYQRYIFFEGNNDKGLYILPCELIDNNGEVLKNIIIKHALKWKLGSGFLNWLDEGCCFYNTLVERIITGYPYHKDITLFKQFGYCDNLLTEGELYHRWILEGNCRIMDEIPFSKAGLNVFLTDNLQEYQKKRVRILNGAHTLMVYIGVPYGLNTVRECVIDKIINNYINNVVICEIIPALNCKDNIDILEYFQTILERFKNTEIVHKLEAISLNSITKFKTRVIPSLIDYYYINKSFPKMLLFSLASMICYYNKTLNTKININDDPFLIGIFDSAWNYFYYNKNYTYLAINLLKSKELWGYDLTINNDIVDIVSYYIKSIINNGIAVSLLNEFST